jgi:hypothetical protein
MCNDVTLGNFFGCFVRWEGELKAPKFVHKLEFGEDGKRTVVVKHPILKIMNS